MSVPVLMITFNRLQYTKRALEALEQCRGAEIFIFDNFSSDGTREYLKEYKGARHIVFGRKNKGIANAMNYFLACTERSQFISKIDNDTLVPPDFIEKMAPHMEHADLVQAKHRLIAASKVGTFDEWVSKMPNITPTLKQNHFIGGSGILFKRQLVNHIPETENKIMGWRQFQRDHPELKKAFATDVEIELLDQDGYPEEYRNYYESTGRI